MINGCVYLDKGFVKATIYFAMARTTSLHTHIIYTAHTHTHTHTHPHLNQFVSHLEVERGVAVGGKFHILQTRG